MNLWQRASGALKDQKALLSASLSRRSSYRIPDLESAIIKATNHNEKHVDYRNAQRVFAWIRASPVSLKPLMWALCVRLERTQNWVVALKGLMLMHGVFCCKTPAVLRIKKLPFDLSNFTHNHNNGPDEIWGFNTFIRAYYTYLDRRWSLLYGQFAHNSEEPRLTEHLVKLENLQSLLDILLQIKPSGDFMRVSLIIEAMDCVVIEIFDVHSRICNVVANVLIGIYSAKKVESLLAIKLLHKALIQVDDLVEYFEFCKEFGVFNAMDIPQLQKIPEDEIRDLERMLNNSALERKNDDIVDVNEKTEMKKKDNVVIEEERVVMKTVITDKWEVFDEEHTDHDYELVKIDEGINEVCHFRTSSNPFETSSNYLPLVPVYNNNNNSKHDQNIPDFITFY